VQSKGSLLTFDDLLVRATGEKLNVQYYLEDLNKRYLGSNSRGASRLSY